MGLLVPRKFVVFSAIIITLILFFILSHNGRISEPEDEIINDKYVEGLIFVRFVEGLNLTNISIIIEDYGLIASSFTYSNETKIGEGNLIVPDGKEKIYIDLLRQDPNILKVDYVFMF